MWLVVNISLPETAGKRKIDCGDVARNRKFRVCVPKLFDMRRLRHRQSIGLNFPIFTTQHTSLARGWRGAVGPEKFFGGGMDDADSSVGVGILSRPRELQFVATSEDTAVSAEDEYVLVIAEHLDQSEYEFVAKLSIACVLLAGLLVWFFWSFWWEKNMRRRVLASRRRNSSRQGAAVRPQSTGSHDSARPSGGDTSPSTQGFGAGTGAGSGSGYQRDAYAFSRGEQEPPPQQQTRGLEEERTADQTITEFFNPLWGKTNSSRGKPSAYGRGRDAGGG